MRNLSRNKFQNIYCAGGGGGRARWARMCTSHGSHEENEDIFGEECHVGDLARRRTAHSTKGHAGISRVRFFSHSGASLAHCKPGPRSCGHRRDGQQGGHLCVVCSTCTAQKNIAYHRCCKSCYGTYYCGSCGVPHPSGRPPQCIACRSATALWCEA